MQGYRTPSAGGIFSQDIHGTRLIGTEYATLPNPDCLISEDAVAIDDGALVAINPESIETDGQN